MIRIAIAGILGFFLLIFESMIVRHLKGYQTFEYGGVAAFINVWAMNFVLVFAIASDIANWLKKRFDIENGEKNNPY